VDNIDISKMNRVTLAAINAMRILKNSPKNTFVYATLPQVRYLAIQMGNVLYRIFPNLKAKEIRELRLKIVIAYTGINLRVNESEFSTTVLTKAITKAMIDETNRSFFATNCIEIQKILGDVPLEEAYSLFSDARFFSAMSNL